MTIATDSSMEIVPSSIRGDGTDSSEPLIAGESGRWADAVDTLLGWCADPADLDPACLDNAIDFAVDQRDQEVDPPSSIIATDDGEITFEWRTKRDIVMVTILGSGQAEYTMFQDCRVVEQGLLRRDPKTRKLQLEAD